MLSFPTSLLLLPVVAALGVVYVTGERWVATRWLPGFHATTLGVVWTLPIFVSGADAGAAKLMVGLLVGFWGVRMVALDQRFRDQQRQRLANGPRADAGPGSGAGVKLAAIFSALMVPEECLTRIRTSGASAEDRQARVWAGWKFAMSGLLALATCAALLWMGNEWRLWRTHRFADNLLVLVEVAVGSAGVHRLIVGISVLVGRPVVGLQNHPLRSSSLSEFWAVRWNRLVQRNLSRAFFQPVIRRARRRSGMRASASGSASGANASPVSGAGADAGSLAAFGASGIMHLVAVADASRWRETWLPSLAVAAFFLLHGVLVIIERRLGLHVPRRRRPALLWSRARTLVLFTLLSPLLLDPFACVAGIHGRSLTAAAVAASRGPTSRPPTPLHNPIRGHESAR